MLPDGIHIVTGAFGFSGRYIARRLLESGAEVHTLTDSPDRENPFGGRVKAHPYSFDDPAQIVETLRGAAVLYNTYWIRFSNGGAGHAKAVANTRTLFAAARKAGVGRIIHVSITNPSEDSDLSYFRGKARVERLLHESGISHAILRPAVLFGDDDILINNIAWLLRKLPVFGVFGDGEYRLQPIFVDDLARLAVELTEVDDNRTVNAVGPETFTFRGLVEEIGRIIGKRRPILGVPPTIGYLIGAAIGKAVGDVVINWQEVRGLMDGLLCVDSPAAGETKLTEWASAHVQTLGARYASELARRENRRRPYREL